MNRSIIGWIAALVIAIGGAAFAWLWFAGGSGEPSTELTTPTIAADSTAPTGEAGNATSPQDDDATSTTEGSGATAFVIDSAQSEASFEIDEELRGTPQTVVGSTDQVAGQVAVDPSDLSTAQFSEIVINARTFQTDSSRRDRAIRGPVILNSASDEFEFIMFMVTSLEGLEGAAQPGETLSFTVTGDLTVKETTDQVTFDVSAMFTDDGTIEGSASTTVLRSDFDIGIPSVPGVANVSDEVVLNLDFVAAAQ